MTTPPTSGQTPTGASPAARFFESIRKLGIVRTDQRWIGGVAGGIARRLGIDPAIVRGIFAVSIVLGGLGLWVYAIAWALLPEEVDGRIHFQELLAGRFDIAIVGAAAMFVAGWASPSTWWGWGVPGWNVVQALVVVAAVLLVVYLIATRRRDPGRSSRPASPPTWQAPPAAGWSGGYSSTGSTAPSGTPASPTSAPVPPMPSSSSGAAMTDENEPAAFGASPDGTGDGTPAGVTAGDGIPVDETAPSLPEDATAPLPTFDATTPMPTTSTTQPGAQPGTAPFGPQPYRPPMESRYGPQPVPPIPVQPVAVRPRVLGPGSVTVAIVVAMTLFTAAAMMIVNRVAGWSIPVAATSIAAFVVYAGVGLIVTGVRGRRSGVLGFLAIVAIVLGVPAAFTSQMNIGGPWGNVTVRPTTVAAASQGLTVGVGHGVVDLTDMPTPTTHLTVPIELGVGQVDLTVPADLPAKIVVKLGGGEADFYQANGEQSEGSTGGWAWPLVTNKQQGFTFETDAAANNPPIVTVTVNADFGQVNIHESN